MATPSVHAKATGINAGTAAIGASTALSKVQAAVAAYTINSRITGTDLSVLATLAQPTGRPTAWSEATGAVGGLIGLNSTVTDARTLGTVAATIDTGSDLALSGTTTLAAASAAQQVSNASSASIGLVAAGATVTTAASAIDTTATIKTVKPLASGAMTVTATSNDDNAAQAIAGSGGLVSGTAASAATSSGGTTTASLAPSAAIDLTGNSAASGAFFMAANHTAIGRSQVLTASYGALAGSGAVVRDSFAHTTSAVFGAGSSVTAREIAASAQNTIRKPQLDQANIVGSTGGIASGAGADSQTTLNVTATVNVDSTAANPTSLQTIGRVADTQGGITLAASNKIDAYDKVTLTTGGAISGAGAQSVIRADAFKAQVLVGASANILTLGTFTASANGSGQASSVSNSETYGAATVAFGNSTVDIRPDNSVSIGASAAITAYGNLNLTAGTDANQFDDYYVTSARTDTFAGSAIPIQSIDSLINLLQTNTVSVAGGAQLRTAGDANLLTNRLGVASTDSKAKGTNWATALAGAIDSVLGGSGQAVMSGTANQGSNGRVIVDGTVETGIARNISIAIDQMSLAWGYETVGTGANAVQRYVPIGTKITGRVLVNGQQLDANGNFIAADITKNTFELVVSDSGTASTVLKRLPIALTFGNGLASSDLVGQLYDAQAKLVTYKQNDTLQTFYKSEINRIAGILTSQGLADIFYDQAGNIIGVRAVQKQVQTLGIGAFTAGAGRITVVADELTGTGSLDAHADTKVEIINDSSASLNIGGITMPESNGGTFFNNTNVTTSSDLAVNRGLIVTENLRNNNASQASGVAFSNLTQGGVVSSTIKSDIIITNTRGAQPNFDNTDIIPAPAINIVGKIYAVNATFTPTTQNGGAYNQFADVRVKGLNAQIGGAVTIKDITSYMMADPYGQIAGTISGGNPNNIINAGDPAAVVNALKNAAQPTLIADGIVTINAQFINIDGLIQSGRDSYTIDIRKNSAVSDEIEQIRANPWRSNVISSLSGNGFSASFDRVNNRIVINEIASSGGKISLTGTMLNTRPDGAQLRALGGYANVTVNNALDYDVVITRIDLSQRGAGIIDIKDLAYANASSGVAFKQTLLQQAADGSVSSYVADLKADGTEVGGHSNGGMLGSYNPKSGYRYAFSVGVGTTTTYTKTTGSSSWLGIDALAADPPDQNNYDTAVTKPGALIPNSGYYYVDADPSQPGYNRDDVVTFYTKNPDGSLGPVLSVGKSWTESTWYGKKTYYQENISVVRQETDATHSIRADYGIAMSFTGNTSGTVTINSTGAGRVLLLGGIANASGSTTITSGGSIEMLNANNAITGTNVTLQAGGSIGRGATTAPTDQAIIVNVTGALLATTTRGTINLTTTGNFAIDRVAASNGYDVRLNARGDITVAAGKTGQIVAGSLTIVAGGKVGGTSAAAALKLDTGNTQRDKVDITASGDVGIEETSGDLRLNSLHTSGNVLVQVDSGDLLNVNNVVVLDTRVADQLINGVWKDLALTTADADAKFNATLDAYETVNRQEYATYWAYRNLQANPAVYDATFQFRFAAGSSELATYQAMYRQQGADKGLSGAALDSYVADAISTLETSRTLQYRTLNNQYGKYGNVYIADLAGAYDSYWNYRSQQADPSQYQAGFTVPVSQAEKDGIRAGILASTLSGDALTAYVADQLANLEADRNRDYQALDRIFGGLGASQSADFGQRYETYWTYRSNLGQDGKPMLSAAQQSYYQKQFSDAGTALGKTGADLDSYVAAQFTQLNSDRNADYVALKATFDRFGDSYNANLATSYATYWGWRGTLDSDGKVHLTSAERTTYTDVFAKAGAAMSNADALVAADVRTRLAAAEAQLKTDYQALNTRFGAQGNAYDATYALTLSSADRTDYATYWGYRSQQANPGVYDSGFAPRLAGDALTAAQNAASTASKAALQAGTLTTTAIDARVQTAVTSLSNARTADYAKLNAFFAQFNLGTTKQTNPHFFVDQATKDAINAGIKRWTQDELINAVGQGLLKETTSTQVQKQDPIITGGNVSIVVRGTAQGGGNVGSVDGVTIIDVSAHQALTKDQLIALGAAERSDIVLLTSAPVPATVTFGNDGGQGVITNLGGNWDPSIFTVGATLYIGGATQNASGESPTVFTIASVSGNVIRTNQVLTAESGKVVSLGVRLASAEAPRATAQITFGPDRTLTRDSGSFLDDGFTVGMRIGVAGAFGVKTANQTDASHYYTIAQVTASTITLVGGDVLTAEDARNVIVFQSALDPANPGNLIKQVLIQGRKPMNLSASGTFSVDADRQIFIGTQGALALGSVTSRNGDEIRIKTNGGLTNAAGANATNITGGNIVLEGGDEAVGTAANVIGIDLKGQGALTVRTAKDIFVTERNGDLNLESAYSQSGSVTLVADGGILDAVHTDTNKIVAANLYLKAKGGSIGTVSDRIEVKLSGTVRASGTGGVYLEETGGNMNLLSAVASNGDVVLKAAASVLNAGFLVNPGDIDSATYAGGAPANPLVNVIANSVTLIAGNTVGTSGRGLAIDSRAAGNRQGNVSAQTVFGNIYVEEVVGDLALGTVGTANTGVAFLTAADGSIVNGLSLYNDADKSSTATGSNLTSGKAYLIAKNDIGADGRRIVARMSANNGAGHDTYGGIEGYSTAGSVYLWNIGGLRVGGVVADTAPGFRAAGTLSIRTSSPLTIDKDIISGGDITQTAGETGASGDDLTVLSGVTIFSTGGNVTLNAGDNLIVQDGATIKAAGAITLRGDYSASGSSDGTGALIDLRGTYVGASITVEGGQNNDDIRLNGTFQTGTRTITFDADNRPVEGALTVGGSITILAKDGDDVVTLGGTFKTGTLTVDAAEGANTVTLAGTFAVAGAMIVTSGSGADVFDLGGVIKAGSLAVSGSAGSGNGLGNDSFTLTGTFNIAGLLALDGGAGIDTLTDAKVTAGAVTASANITAGAIAIDLKDGANVVSLGGHYTVSNAFTLSTGADADSITDAISANGAVLQTATIETGSFALSAGAGDNTITLLGSTVAASTLAITTLGGRDRVALRGRMRSTTTDIHLGAGDDTLEMTLLEIAGNTNVYGEDGQDTIVVNRLPDLTSAAANGRRDTLNIDGGQDTDTVRVQLAGASTYRINVHDSGDADRGVDTLTILGTDAADTFLMRKNFVALVHPNADGTYPANTAVERINVDASLNGRIVVEGGLGDDRFYMDDDAALMTVDGGAGNDFFQMGQIFATPRDVANGLLAEDAFDTVQVSFGGYLSKGNSVPVVIYGGTGDDTFQIYSNKADLRLEGEDGDDQFIIRAFALADNGKIKVNAGAGNDKIEYNINAPVDIDGGSGFNKVVALGTEFADTFVVTRDGVYGAGLSIKFANIQAVEVDGLEGDDTFYVLSTAPGVVTTLIGGLGSDTFNVAGDVSGEVVARDAKGNSAVINHTISSTDPRFDGLFVAGVTASVSTADGGAISDGGGLTLREDSAVSTPNAVGSSVGTYTVAPPAPTTTALTASDTAVVTVSAAQASSQNRALAGNAGTVEVSLDGVTYADALTIAYSTVSDGHGGYVWQGARTVYVRAKSDTAAEGDQKVAIGHSVLSSNAEVNGTWLRTTLVTVLDDDKAGIIVTQSDGDTTVIEGNKPQQKDDYTVVLNNKPLAGETVRVTLLPDSNQITLTRADGSALPLDQDGHAYLEFTDQNWSTAQTVLVAAPHDGIAENRQLVNVTHKVTSSLGANGFFGNVVEQPIVRVTVIDSDTASVLVRPAPGGVVVTDTQPSYYDMVLTTQPTGPVTVSIANDGQTIQSSSDPRFTAASNGHPASVTFGPNDYDTPIRIIVSRDPNGTRTTSDLKTFSRQPHDVSAIEGPLVVIGGVGPQNRGLQQAIALPGEANAVVTRDIANNGQPDLDKLIVYNDSTNVGVTGELTFDHIGGLGMASQDIVTGGANSQTYRGGITYTSMSVVQVLLGQGNDTFTVKSTADATLTEIDGGGGADRLIVTGSTGPLALFGDTSADNSRYDSTPQNPTGRAFAFRTEGMTGVDGNPVSLDDYIDASGATGIVMIDGGAGRDTIIGGQGRNYIAGGAGNDSITGGPAADYILGDSAFNLDVATRFVTIDDTGLAGADTIDAAAGDNVVIGDHGQIYQDGAATPGFHLEGAHVVSRVVSTNTTQGAADIITATAGNNVIIGGAGADRITVGAGNHVIFGDNGDAVFTAGVLTSVTTLDGANGGDDQIQAADGNSTIIGGAGSDVISVGKGTQVILGDTGEATFDVVNGARVLLAIKTKDGEAAVGGADTITAADGDTTIIGGAGADSITVGKGTQVILGDSGSATFSDGKIASITSVATDIGGDDVIEANDGDATILGGAGADQITVGIGNHVILGDNGQALFTLGMLTRIETIDPAIGGNDVIKAKDGNTTIIGGAGADQITLGSGTQVVLGDSGVATFVGGKIASITSVATDIGGDDVIEAKDGDATILGGAGADQITVGTGNHVILGDNGQALFTNGVLDRIESIDPAIGGNDVIKAEDGNTTIIGGAGADQITLGSGTQVVLGDSGVATFLDGVIATVTSTATDIGGDDIISAQDGDVTIIGGAGADRITAGRGNHVILGDNGQATFTLGLADHVESIDPGIGGDDVIQASDGNDVILGGAGADSITTGAGDHVILGDSGQADFVVALQNGVAKATRSKVETLAPDIGGDDHIVFGSGRNVVLGGAGGDLIEGADQGAVILGDNGVVTFDAAGVILRALSLSPEIGGDDRITAGNGNNVVLGGAGADTIGLGDGNNVVLGDSGQADFTNGAVTEIASIAPSIGGNDQITLGKGGNVVIGGAGSDTITAGDGADVVIGDAGHATLTATGLPIFVETLNPEVSGDDVIRIGNGSSVVLGGSGADRIAIGNGHSVVLGDNGTANFDALGRVARVATTVPTIGGNDQIVIGDGGSVAIGGVGDDQITSGSGDDVVLGDNGLATFVAGVLSHLESTDPTIGGNDTIDAGDGDNVVIGGVGADTITTGAGADAILGDNGVADFITAGGARVLRRLQSTDPLAGGNDRISAGAGNDFVAGGTGDDVIDGGAGNDILFGDHALYDLALPANQRGVAIYTRAADGGGNDVIHGGAGDDLIYGQQGDDQLFGDDGDDDITGGSNVIGAADGNDTISGGNGNDVIIGDNGMILRQVLVDDVKHITWQMDPAPFAAARREVTLFDLIDGVGGGDHIMGDAGDDRLFGQTGDDWIEGGDGADEIVGGLGSDRISGGAGNDMILGDLGRIVRAYRPDGSALLNSDGSWHKDVVLEEVGTITRVIATDSRGSVDGSLDIGALAKSDLLLVTGARDAAGNLLNAPSGSQATALLAVSLGQAYDDVIDGDGGDDTIFGQRGDDTLRGGDGNDVIYGDRASNTAEYVSDQPTIVNAVRLMSAPASAGFALPLGGAVVVPAATLLPQALNATAPRIDIYPVMSGPISALSGAGPLQKQDGTSLTVYASVMPNLVDTHRVLYGNDTIDGGAGDDTIYGDDSQMFSLDVTRYSSLNAQIDSVTLGMQQLLAMLDGVSSGVDAIDYANGHASPVQLRFGNDTITGGSGNDVIVGDAGRTVVGGSGLATDRDSALALNGFLAAMRTAVADATAAAGHARDSLVYTMQNMSGVSLWLSRYYTPDMFAVRHELVVGNDTIDAGDGDDLVVGDNLIIVKSGIAQSQTFMDGWTDFEIGQRVAAQDAILQAHLAIAHPVDAVATATGELTLGGGQGYALAIGNDSIRTGAGNDVVIGDTALIQIPSARNLQGAPAWADALAADRAQVIGRLFAHATAPFAADGSIPGDAQLLSAATFNWGPDGQSFGRRPGAVSIGNDTIEIGSGSKRLFGGTAVLVPVLDWSGRPLGFDGIGGSERGALAQQALFAARVGVAIGGAGNGWSMGSGYGWSFDLSGFWNGFFLGGRSFGVWGFDWAGFSGGFGVGGRTGSGWAFAWTAGQSGQSSWIYGTDGQSGLPQGAMLPGGPNFQDGQTWRTAKTGIPVGYRVGGATDAATGADLSTQRIYPGFGKVGAYQSGVDQVVDSAGRSAVIQVPELTVGIPMLPFLRGGNGALLGPIGGRNREEAIQGVSYEALRASDLIGALLHSQIVLRTGAEAPAGPYRSYVFDERSGSLVLQDREDFLLL